MQRLYMPSFKITKIKFCLYYSLFTLLLNIPFFKNTYQKIGSTNIYTFASILLGTLAIQILFSSIFVSKIFRKWFLYIILMINSAVLYYTWQYNIYIDRAMIVNIMHTDTKEVLELLNIQMLLAIFWCGVLPCFALSRVTIIYDQFLKSVFRTIILILSFLLIAIGIIYANYKEVSTFARTNKKFLDQMFPYNYMSSLLMLGRQKVLNANQKMQPLELRLDKNAKPIVFIFVIGETARSANFSLLGYSRNTNPLLAKDDVIAFNGTSCGTSTAESVPCMVSHLSKSTFGKGKFENIPHALQSAGVKVTWNTNNASQGQEKGLGNIPNKSNDELCNKYGCYDGILLSSLEQYIDDNKGKNLFIVLHTKGSHGPKYYERYPKAFNHFKPVCDKNDLQNCTREELVNAYDNSILYTDYILHSIIKVLQSKSNIASMMLYASDHGESLGEYGLYLHGAPYSIAPKEQKNIPIILWLSDRFKQEIGLKVARKSNLSHDNIAHTILGAFGAKDIRYYRTELDLLT